MILEEHSIYIKSEHACLSCGLPTTNQYTCGACQAIAEIICGDDSVSLLVERAEV